ncbi:NfeD family protein [Paenarthrobacter sp. DKR-5]|uniref:NfeD family protein n=1 Tax=Paenarthrobacter sp. DKR-5 TaxID=2835535 RepID=UPI001BDBD15C|nr:NfeD family protein [Paenarthrobacter sp. DKR-5]MBT1001762.1 NfeD family protein [Paenarthrobacter sp. DKR-5]
MLDWLVGNGWALWLAVFLVLAVVEMLTLDLFFIMMSGGALAALVAYFLGTPLWLQIVVFCVVALLMILFVRPLGLRHLRKGPPEQRTNVDRLLGQPAVVLEDVSEAGGLVKIGGDTWTARSRGEIFPAGTRVAVSEISGATAIVAGPGTVAEPGRHAAGPQQ